MAYGTYDRQVIDSSVDDHGQATAIEMEASTGAILTKTAKEPMSVDRFGFLVTELFQYHTLTTIGVLTLYKYPQGVAANKLALATINLEDGAQVGCLYYVNVDNKCLPAVYPYTGVKDVGIADLNPGDQVVIEISTQGVGDIYVLGAFQPVFFWHNRAEDPGNMTQVFDRTPVKTPVNEPLGNNPVTSGFTS